MLKPETSGHKTESKIFEFKNSLHLEQFQHKSAYNSNHTMENKISIMCCLLNELSYLLLNSILFVTYSLLTMT
jgi:hypothetical protein